MEPVPPFPIFGGLHLATLAAMALLGLATVAVPRCWPNRFPPRKVAVAFAVYMLAQECLDRGWHYFVEQDGILSVLPLHLCGMSVFLTALLLLTRSYAIFEVLYFWGLAGAGMAILTPDVKFGCPHLLFITFFVSHAQIIIGVAYAAVHWGYRPTIRSLVKVILLTNLYMLVVAPVDWALQANYLFLCEKPAGISLLDALGPWPWYILGMEAAGIVIFGLCYLPWGVADALRSHRTSSLQAAD